MGRRVWPPHQKKVKTFLMRFIYTMKIFPYHVLVGVVILIGRDAVYMRLIWWVIGTFHLLRSMLCPWLFFFFQIWIPNSAFANVAPYTDGRVAQRRKCVLVLCISMWCVRDREVTYDAVEMKIHISCSLKRMISKSVIYEALTAIRLMRNASNRQQY